VRRAGDIFAEQDFIELRFTQEAEVKKVLPVLFWSAMLVLIAPQLRAQTGCDDSPEDPTVVLALVGGAGALVAGVWRSRRR
jgi:XrtJ-associated TM-motif-TM protein